MDNRLSMLASLVSCRTLSDIGCDHALIDIALIENNVCDRIIASDLRIGPLKAANKNITEHNLNNKIETRLSNGLDKYVPGETESILISGMGGRLITSILKNGFKVAASAKELILSPQSEIKDFESWLLSHGFEISKKEICKESNKFYFGYLVHYVGGKVNAADADNTDTLVDTHNADKSCDSGLSGALASLDFHYMLPAVPTDIYLEFLKKEEERYRYVREIYLEKYEKVKAEYPGKNFDSDDPGFLPEDVLQKKIEEIQYEINRFK